ncbi:MAG: YbjQ family protein, partial [Euryarchaeota archaeon]|nr:YbjQ family protein [Euryarchaeota archaeon]
IINGYGWFAPGRIFPKEPVTFSLITVIAIILTIQAAFPIFVNYLLFVTGLGIVRKFIGFLIFLPSKILKIPPKEEVKVKLIKPAVDEIFLDNLDTPLTTIPAVKGGKIKKYIGLVTGEAVAQENESEGKLDMLTRIIEPTPLEDMNLGEARKLALSRMMDDAKSQGANAVIEFKMDYVSMGGLQGSALIVTATGTAVLYE